MIETLAVWEKNLRVKVRARQFSVDTDEPPEYKGEDTGMMPTEMFISSLASCFCMALVFAAGKMKVELKDMEVGVSAVADKRNFRYSKLIVRVKSSVEDGLLEELITLARKYCYVSNMISDSCEVIYEIN